MVHIRGVVEKYSDFILFLKTIIIYLFIYLFIYLLLLKYSPPTSIYFCHLRGSFCIPSANHEVDLLLRYRFTADI